MKQKTMCKEMMKNDLMKVYREVSSSGECRMQTEAYERTVEHEAPRFYVDARWAHQRIAPMLRGDRSGLDNMKPLQRKMYEDLFSVVVRLSQKDQFWGKKLNYILQYAVLEPAPRFYIGTMRMGQIWKEMTRRANERRRKNYGKHVVE